MMADKRRLVSLAYIVHTETGTENLACSYDCYLKLAAGLFVAPSHDCTDL